MEIKQKMPISNGVLWENTWVFYLYGLGVSFVASIFSYFEHDLSNIEKIMMEPIGIYAFSTLSLIGLLSLGIINITSAKSAAAMKIHKGVNVFCLPIANVGLATGAIILGMMAGLASGMWLYSVFNPEAINIAKIFTALSFFVVALLYPLVVMKRSMFDETIHEQRRTIKAGVAYCATVLGVIWLINEEIFWQFIITFFVISIGAGVAMQYMRRKNG